MNLIIVILKTSSGDPTPSYYSPDGGPYDGKLAENMRTPVFVLGHDNNVTGIVQNNKHQAFIDDLPRPLIKQFVYTLVT